MRRPAIILASFSTIVIAQNSPPPETHTPTFKSQARQVLVPIVVTDGRGRHISGLKASDFEIFEDGMPVRIVAFSAETDGRPEGMAANAGGGGSAGPGARRSSPNNDDPRRTYLIIIDTLHS